MQGTWQEWVDDHATGPALYLTHNTLQFQLLNRRWQHRSFTWLTQHWILFQWYYCSLAYWTLHVSVKECLFSWTTCLCLHERVKCVLSGRYNFVYLHWPFCRLYSGPCRNISHWWQNGACMVGVRKCVHLGNTALVAYCTPWHDMDSTHGIIRTFILVSTNSKTVFKMWNCHHLFISLLSLICT